jgi:hypothetical protein
MVWKHMGQPLHQIFPDNGSSRDDQIVGTGPRLQYTFTLPFSTKSALNWKRPCNTGNLRGLNSSLWRYQVQLLRLSQKHIEVCLES